MVLCCRSFNWWDERGQSGGSSWLRTCLGLNNMEKRSLALAMLAVTEVWEGLF